MRQPVPDATAATVLAANAAAASLRRFVTDPEGLQGWHPDDFVRPGMGGGRGGDHPDIDPDVGQPGPGRGTDWDSMYG